MKCKHVWKELINKEMDVTYKNQAWNWDRDSNSRAVINEHEITGKQFIYILSCEKCGEINKTTTLQDNNRYY